VERDLKPVQHPAGPLAETREHTRGECLEIRGADFGQLFEVEAKPAPEWLWPFAPQSSRRSRQQVGQRAGQPADPDDTSTSPLRQRSIARRSCGRSRSAPEARSSKITEHPARLSTSVCGAVVCSSVDTRA
jgi:hypothetical protein